MKVEDVYRIERQASEEALGELQGRDTAAMAYRLGVNVALGKMTNKLIAKLKQDERTAS